MSLEASSNASDGSFSSIIGMASEVNNFCYCFFASRFPQTQTDTHGIMFFGKIL